MAVHPLLREHSDVWLTSGAGGFTTSQIIFSSSGLREESFCNIWSFSFLLSSFLSWQLSWLDLISVIKISLCYHSVITASLNSNLSCTATALSCPALFPAFSSRLNKPSSLVSSQRLFLQTSYRCRCAPTPSLDQPGCLLFPVPCQ